MQNWFWLLTYFQSTIEFELLTQTTDVILNGKVDSNITQYS